MHPRFAVDPHAGMIRIVHPAGISLGSQPLPIGLPQVLPQRPALPARVHNGVGGKEGHLGVVRNERRASGLRQSLDARGTVLLPDGILTEELNRVSQRVSHRASQEAAQKTAALDLTGIGSSRRRGPGLCLGRKNRRFGLAVILQRPKRSIV